MSKVNGPPAGVDAVAVRDEWVAAANELISRVEGWCKELDWATRRTSKRITDDQEIGPYEVPMLLIQRWDTKLLLSPVSHSVAGGGGRADLYTLPEYDDVAVLLWEDRNWRMQVQLGRDSREAEFTRDSFREVLEVFSQRASPLPDTPARQCFVRGKQIILVSPDGEYPIDLDRCDNAAKILGWVTHLADKVWVSSQLLKLFVKCAAIENKVAIDYDA